MKREYVCDMTKGNEVSLLAKFAMPMLIGNIFQQFYNMVDSIIVGKYVGADSLAAVGATGSLNFLFISLCIGLASGVGIIIAQYFGAGEDTNVKRSIVNAIYLMIASGILMSILSFVFARKVLELLNTPKGIIDDSVCYMRIISLGILVVSIYNAVASTLRALGDSVTPLIFLIISSIVNVGLDLIFVVNFNMGVMGVGIATIISQLASAIGCMAYALKTNPYFKIEKDLIKIDWRIIGLCSKIGIPVAAQSALIAVSCIILQGVVNNFGKTLMAAYTATSRIEQLVQQPFNSLGAAIATFTGQNIGARKLDRVKKGYYKSCIIAGIFSILMLVAFQFFGEIIMKIFVNDENVIKYGVEALRITSWFYFPLGMIYIIRGMLNGASDSVFSMLAGLVEVIGRVTFPVILIGVLAFGIKGIWYTTGLTWVITAVFCLYRYKQGKWKYKSVINKNIINAKLVNEC